MFVVVKFEVFHLDECEDFHLILGTKILKNNSSSQWHVK